MKRILFTLITLLVINATAQDWQANLPTNKTIDELTLNDYQEAFNTYWDSYNVKNGYYFNTTGEKTKAPGWKLFKRWENYWQSRVNVTTGVFPKKAAIDIYNNWKTGPTNFGTKSLAGNWQPLGPSSSAGGYAGIGRVNVIAFHPTDSNTYWVGTPAGGLWKTTDDGNTWSTSTDTNDVLGVSEIVLSSNFAADNTMYIGTGDRDGGSLWALNGEQYSDNYSIGVLKSTDGGNTWNATGLSYTATQKRSIYSMLIDPTDNNILYVATSVGLYKTSNAGVDWVQLTPSVYIDIKLKPGTPSTIYASSLSGDIYRSTDSGTSFSSVLSTSNGRVELAVTPNNAAIVYAIMDGSGKQGGIYISTNSGASFAEAYAGSKNLIGYQCDGSGLGDQGDYDLCIGADPTNANTLFIGGVNTWKSTDAGASWSIDTHWSGTCGGDAQAIHSDKHYLAFQNGTSTLFQCNDGGVYKTTDGGDNWVDKSNGIVNSQMYRIGVSQTEANATICGLQDNGTKLRRSDTNWQDVYGGDGMECIIDYTDYNVQYGTYVNGEVARTTNAWLSSTGITKDFSGNWINGIDAGESGSWVTPYVIDKNDNNTLYLGLKDVWKTTDRGNNWNKISTIDTWQGIQSMAVAPSSSNTIYVADPNQLWVTTNGGASWTERTAGLPVASNTITYIAVKNDDPNTVWVSFGGYNTDRIYQSTNAGASWTNISTGLPSLPTMTVVQNKQNTAETELYVGTDVGVYIKVGANNWQQYQTGLPNVVIAELDIYYDNATPENSRLRAGTFGRGLWETDLYTAPSGPMVYDSATTTQDNTTDTFVGNVDQEIIGIQVVTTGNESPINITSFTFSTAGSTAPATDIANAKVYYTNNSAFFATANQFGGVVANPDGTFTLTGTQTLISGTNYFWLTYDIDAAAIGDNVVDATCTSITVNGTAETPTLTNPAGNRRIASCVLCASEGTTDWQTSTTLVNFNTINNASAKPSGYSNYTAISTDVELGSTHNLTVNVNTDGDYTVASRAWIDWNHDCDFDDAGEVYDLGTGNNVSDGATTLSPLAITIPGDASLGNTTMRVSTKYGIYATSCETDFDGETEDYTINVTEGVDNTPPVPDETTLADITAQCEVTSLTIPTATDAVSGVVNGTHTTTLPITTQGTTVITWSYEDEAGNIATQTQNVIIDDTTNPATPTIATVTGECSATVTTTPTTTDNCSGTITGTTTNPLTYNTQGTHIITWTFDDGNGNSIDVNQNVVINDTTAPVADTSALAAITAECEVATLTAPTATDNCEGTITGTHTLALPITETTIVTWTFDDGNGNTSSQTQNITIDDNLAPVANEATLVDIASECEVTSLTVPTATDNCDGVINGTHNATLPITENTVIEWTYTDGNGNTATQLQNINVEDTTTPELDTIPLVDVTSECEVTSLTVPTATDNCDGVINGIHNATFPITTTSTVTWTYEDAHGNSITQTQNVVITPIDNTVTQDEYTLTANATGYAYQWLDCDDGSSPILGETNQSYTATTNGNYAVEVSNGTCSVISDCIAITGIGILENEFGDDLNVFPIPTKEYLAIELGDTYDNITVKVMNLLGQLVQKETYRATDKIEMQLHLSAGEYLLNIATKKGKKATIRIMIK